MKCIHQCISNLQGPPTPNAYRVSNKSKTIIYQFLRSSILAVGAFLMLKLACQYLQRQQGGTQDSSSTLTGVVSWHGPVHP